MASDGGRNAPHDGVAEPPDCGSTADRPAETLVTVRSPGGDTAFSCRPGERLLYAGLRSGMNLPYECATGTCGSCRMRGDPAAARSLWPEAPGHAKLKQGREVLMCQSVPRPGCAIESPAPLPDWPEDLPKPDHYRGRVVSRQALAPDVAAVTLALDRPMRFSPGQFAVLRTPLSPGYRAYSMVDGDGSNGILIFVVKRQPDGVVSPWLVEGPERDMPIEVFGPLGRAVLRPGEEAHLLIAAGGTGIAGLLAILQQAARRGHFERFRADVVFGVRTLGDVFLLNLLAELASRWPDRVRVVVALSDEPLMQAQHPNHPAIALMSGTVDAVLSRTIDGPRCETIAFVGGPPPMVDASIRVLLKSARLPPSAIRFDRFW